MSTKYRNLCVNSGSTLVILGAALLAVALFATQAQAQTWTQVSTTGPSARDGCAMAYDSSRGVTVLFGGWNGSSYLRDTWEWNGIIWTQVSSSGPSTRRYHAMAFDSTRGVTVLFGGRNNAGYLGDTWEWNGSTWTQVSTSGPSVRRGSALAYDSNRGVTVLFGGWNGTSYLGDTWEWNGTSWAQVSTSGPSSRGHHAMAFDSARGYTVLMGGVDGANDLSDTWEWNGASWAQVSTGAPWGRNFHAMAFDSRRGRMILFGGSDDESDTYGSLVDTWSWNGSTWVEINTTPSPSARDSHAMAYDITRDQVVLFGGSNYSVPKGDTWEFGPNFNLVLNFKKVKPRSAVIGGKLKMIVIVRNTGSDKAPPSNAYFYLSANTTLDQNDIILGSKPVKGLKPNKSKRVRLKVTVPANVTPGTYYVIVEVVPAAVNSRGIVAVYGRTITIN